MGLKNKLIGDREFYGWLVKVALPIIIQNAITNFVGLLDNLMVGQLGTEMMSGVSIVNQLMMVYGVSMFGVIMGSSIFGAQFFGQGNMDGVRNTMRTKIVIGMGFTVLWITLYITAKVPLINLFLTEDGSGDLALTLSSGISYLMIMLVGLVPFTMSQIYSSTLREAGETFVPMVSSTVAVFVNLVGNFILIFGHFGAPKMGVAGAALATVISRFVEFAIVAGYSCTHTEKYPFMAGVFKSFHIPGELAIQIIKKGLPLIFNETLWSVSMAMLTQCYSTRGLSAVAAFNINSTVANLFSMVFFALGSAISIMVGQLLGAGKEEEAYDTDIKLIFTATVMSIVLGAILFILAPLFPRLYNTSEDIKALATLLIRANACMFPFYALYNGSYSSLRTGGKTIVTFIFDSFTLFLISVPLCFVLTRFTGLPLVVCYLCVQGVEAAKALIGMVLVKRRVWLNNLVSDL